MSRKSSSAFKSNTESNMDQSVLSASPRGGGYLTVSPDFVNLQTEHQEYTKSSCACKGDTESESNWQEASETRSLSLTSIATGVDFNFLGNLITVIMLLASDNQPTDLQLQIALNYLECIKDDAGNAPPNVQGLMNHIHMVLDGGTENNPNKNDVPNEEKEKENEETNK